MKIIRQLIFILAMAALLGLVPGCKTSHVHTETFDFSQYHTFAIRPMATGGAYFGLEPTFRQAMQETLIGKGFKEVPEGGADFQVSLLFDQLPVAPHEVGRKELHTFEIQISDSKSNKVVWSNWRKRAHSHAMSPETARKVVAEMLEPFPPGAAH